jgi:hypothetical protein
MTNTEPEFRPIDFGDMTTRDALSDAVVQLRRLSLNESPDAARSMRKTAAFIDMILDQRGMDAFENGADELPEFIDIVIFG